MVAEKFLFERSKHPMINQSCCVSCSKSLRKKKVGDGSDGDGTMGDGGVE